MERFKAVEKAMKTKAYSKEGLSASTKLDPKEQAKGEASDFLNDMVAELEMQIEALEAEGEALQATMKKGKGHSAKAERMAAIERVIERHKWHQGKLELIRRSLDNGGVEPDQVTDLEESIRYYVTDGQNDDFNEDDGLYDDLNLEEEEDQYGMNVENDKGSSQDTQSVQDEPEPETRPGSIPGGKTRPAVEQAASTGRRPSTQLKSPLPTLATVHTTPLPTMGTSAPASSTMKPASVPTRPAGEGLKYASAAAAAAAADKNGVGIAPLPPPAGAPVAGVTLPPSQTRASTTTSPSTAPIQLASQAQAASQHRHQDADRYSTPAEVAAASIPAAAAPAPALVKKTERENAKATSSRGKAAAPVSAPPQSSAPASEPSAVSSSKGGFSSGYSDSTPQQRISANCFRGIVKTNGVPNGGAKTVEQYLEEESVYHLPAVLQDLVDSFETTKSRGPAALNTALTAELLGASLRTAPSSADSEPPKHYRPDQPLPFSSILPHYPQEPLPIFDNPQLYSRIDPDTLFYVFYYKQGSYQQFLAAKALKDQSWRFHKQYQTWFQRHEEPKAITEEFEQGTYRFFDYESTWLVILIPSTAVAGKCVPVANLFLLSRMNRRKADFRFAYKFLEDDV
jgi:CCR4-NOT transcription complex subunit 3